MAVYWLDAWLFVSVEGACAKILTRSVSEAESRDFPEGFLAYASGYDPMRVPFEQGQPAANASRLTLSGKQLADELPLVENRQVAAVGRD